MNTYIDKYYDLRLQDNMELMKEYPDRYFDLAIVDPPYGINESGQTNGSRGGLAKSKDYGNKNWDSNSPDLMYFNELFRVSKNQIIWGANHFISKIPFDSSSWVVWDKMNGESDFADCELDPDYWKDSIERLKQHRKQLSIFQTV